MTLYHGSATPDITTLLPRKSNHEKAYVYLTDHETLAKIYAHNPLTPPDGFFTYRFSSDGRLHYDEYFDRALETIYQGRKGYVYACECRATPLAGMPWIYLSEEPVPVGECRAIDDLYEDLLRDEADGRLIIHRFATLPDSFKTTIDQMIRREIDDRSAADARDDGYLAFLRLHFPHLFV